MNATGMVTVWLDVAKENDQELNDWYEQEHVAHVVGIEGFLSGFRYFCAVAAHRFVVLYEARDASVEPGPGFQDMVAHPTPWTVKIRAMFQRQKRNNYRRSFDTGAAAAPLAVVIVPASVPPDFAHAQRCLQTVPGCTRYRAFEEAATPDAWLEVFDFSSAQAAQASGLGIPEQLYQAIGQPVIRASA
jgi:hypothetical protein